jgi:hypothetical protein
MTSETGKARIDWRRAVAGGVLAVGLMSGFGVSTAFAQPAAPTETETPTAQDTRQPGESCTGEDCAKPVAGEPETRAPGESCTGEDCAKPVAGEAEVPGGRQANMTADEALMIIYNEYNMGEGGGQLSRLIDDVMNLRAQGFKASNANKLAIQDALDHRPNQAPLIEALKATLQYQRKLQAQQQMAAAQQQQQQQQQVPGANLPVAPGG